MKKYIIFIMLYITIYCYTECESFEGEPSSPEVCHKLTPHENEYCCYFKGKNLSTNQKEIFCWAFLKTSIDDDKIDDTIK